MLIQGTCNSNKTNFLVDKYIDLIAKGTPLNQILVITLNPFKRANFINEIYKKNPNLQTEKHNILTFWGLCYNAFNDNWEFISKLINNNSDKPNLCGLEVSQYIFKQSIKEADFSDYISKVNLLHQLFRRYSLIVQNSLTNQEVKERSESIKESFWFDAQKAIDDYKLKTIQYKSFDYLRQLAILPSIYKKTDYFKNIKYLFVDDADELSYAFWQFVEFLTPQLNDYFIAYDENGSSRCGYLCAYKSGINDFIQKHQPQKTSFNDSSKFFEIANNIFEKIKKEEKLDTSAIKHKIATKRLDMFEDVVYKIKTLIKQGVKPNEILVTTPVLDEFLIQNFKEQNHNIKFQILSGSEKLAQNDVIKHILILLKLLNNVEIRDYELKSLLINLLKIPYRKSVEIIREYSNNKNLKDYHFEEESYNYSYNKLRALINSENKSKNTITNQIKIIYTNIIKEFAIETNKEKYDFLFKEAESFEAAFQNNIQDLTKEFILQLENSVISENPVDSFAFEKDAVVIASPQKVIDFSIKTKHQLWLDISNSEWKKQDTGTLYNAWVLNRDWNKKEFTLEDNISLTLDKTARIIRKLMLCSQEQITFFSSLYDNTGNENFGGLAEHLKPKEETENPTFKIIPREDQKPVLEYKDGKMGVMAVPGAGKTTILLALIIKLLEEKIPAENIFVLTYMESAAKNFKERIKLAIPEGEELPNISTIHGLALRIIKENGNHNLVGLDENFEICDDNTKEKIIKELFFKLKIEDEKYDNYLRCISIVKLSTFSGKLYSKFKEIQDFYRFFEAYNLSLKKQNIIDYDDMLCFAVKILEENPTILRYYQKICKYIIEDEAQDSTDIQQKLISLLNSKHNNLVRCGDINQAITSTFTNSNLESFKSFVNKNNKVEMTSSQRCAKQIFSLANNLIKESRNDEETKTAFYNIEMQGTQKNPISDVKPKYITFENEREEKSFIIQKSKEILKNNPSASIAILLRLNSQVNDYNELFLSEGIKTSVRTDCLSQKRIYRIVIAVLKIIQNPMSNNQIINLADEYKQHNIYDFTKEDLEYIKTLNKPFAKINPDELNNEGLLQLFWDIDYWLNNSSIESDILSLNIGLYYSKNSVDKSNSYLVSTIIRKLIQQKDNLEDVIQKLEYASQKPLSAYKFFEDENKDSNEIPISIMTMHKSKGDEFDYVFIPEMNEENYSCSIKNVKLKSGSHFVQTIKNSVENSNLKTQEELKLEQVNETLRLIYVGITRARKELYISNATNYKRRKNTKSISIIERLFLEYS